MFLTVSIPLLGALGTFLRWIVDHSLANRLPHPTLATLAVNALGSFAIGVIYVLGAERGLLSRDLTLALSVGLLGGFTTFSTYALQTLLLARDGAYSSALFYFLGSPTLALAMVALGFVCARAG
jgi:CrcB protein